MGIPAPSELILILLILVVIFGAKRIPEIMGSIGQGIKTLKKSMDSGEPSAPPEVTKPHAQRHPEGDVLVGLLFYSPRTPNPHAVPIEQELEHQGRVIGRMAALKMKVFLGYFAEIQGINHIADEQAKVIRRQPFPDIRCKLQWLVRLVWDEAVVSHDARHRLPPGESKALSDRFLVRER